MQVCCSGQTCCVKLWARVSGELVKCVRIRKPANVSHVRLVRMYEFDVALFLVESIFCGVFPRHIMNQAWFCGIKALVQ